MGVTFLLPSVKVDTISHGIFNDSILPFSLTFNIQLASSAGLPLVEYEEPDDDP